MKNIGEQFKVNTQTEQASPSSPYPCGNREGMKAPKGPADPLDIWNRAYEATDNAIEAKVYALGLLAQEVQKNRKSDSQVVAQSTAYGARLTRIVSIDTKYL